jgi:hypothetical protein
MTKRKEAHLNGAIYEIQETISSGYNRDVYRVKAINGEMKIIKILGEKQPLTAEELARQYEYIDKYRKKLEDVGVPVPEQIEIFLVASEAPILAEISADLGREVATILRVSKKEECLDIVKKILNEALFPLFKTEKGGALEIGIDPLTRNFIFNGKIVYVDLFPVKLTIGGVKKLEFPEPDGDGALTVEARRLGLFRHYSKRGVLFVFFLDLCRVRPEFRPEFKKEVLNFCQKKLHDDKIAQLFSCSPANYICRSRKKAERIILSQSGRGVSYFYLRSIACELAYLTEDTDKLEKFFKMTHFQDKAMADEEIETAKAFLVRWVKAIKT